MSGRQQKQLRKAEPLRDDPGRGGERWWWIGGAASLAVVLIGLYIANRPPAPSPPPPRTGSPPAGVETFSESGRQHGRGAVKYDHTPPAGGDHSPVWLNCGIYDQPVPNENAVHSLEHGAVWITYVPTLSSSDVSALRALVSSEYDGTNRYVVLSPYPGLPSPIVATAWGNQLKGQKVTDPGLKQFIEYFRAGPQDLEHGAPCTGGVGAPLG